MVRLRRPLNLFVSRYRPTGSSVTYRLLFGESMSTFTFMVFTRRLSSTATYNVTKTTNGWDIHHIAINGDCKPDGSPLFYSNFDQNNVVYPSNFGSFLSHIWTALDREEINDADAQEKLQELADWVSTCERSQPEWKGWNC